MRAVVLLLGLLPFSTPAICMIGGPSNRIERQLNVQSQIDGGGVRRGQGKQGSGGKRQEGQPDEDGGNLGSNQQQPQSRPLSGIKIIINNANGEKIEFDVPGHLYNFGGKGHESSDKESECAPGDGAFAEDPALERMWEANEAVMDNISDADSRANRKVALAHARPPVDKWAKGVWECVLWPFLPRNENGDVIANEKTKGEAVSKFVRYFFQVFVAAVISGLGLFFLAAQAGAFWFQGNTQITNNKGALVNGKGSIFSSQANILNANLNYLANVRNLTPDLQGWKTPLGERDMRLPPLGEYVHLIKQLPEFDEVLASGYKDVLAKPGQDLYMAPVAIDPRSKPLIPHLGLRRLLEALYDGVTVVHPTPAGQMEEEGKEKGETTANTRRQPTMSRKLIKNQAHQGKTEKGLTKRWLRSQPKNKITGRRLRLGQGLGPGRGRKSRIPTPGKPPPDAKVISHDEALRGLKDHTYAIVCAPGTKTPTHITHLKFKPLVVDIGKMAQMYKRKGHDVSCGKNCSCSKSCSAKHSKLGSSKVRGGAKSTPARALKGTKS